jgi:hypothetical protein
MINYTWSILGLDCSLSENGLSNVIKVIHWQLTGKDENGVVESISNSYPLQNLDQDSENFKDFSTLTKEMIISWLENSLDVQYLKQRISNNISNYYNQPIIPLPLPWIKIEQPIEEVIEQPILDLEDMIADGYKPNARDGDNDGMVQDGTDWERPINTL